MDTELFFGNLSDERSTPQFIFDLLHREFKFTIDAAASKLNAKLTNYYDKEKDGLKQVWRREDRMWCNPPYSVVKDWMKKGAESEAASIFLVAARTDTRWFHDYVFSGADWVLFYKGRLKFNGMRTPAPFPSAIVGFNCHPPTASEILSMGYLLPLKTLQVYRDMK